MDDAGQLRVAQLMRDWIRVIEIGQGKLVYSLAPGFNDDPAAELREALLKVTGQRWLIEKGQDDGVPTLREQAEQQAKADQERLRSHPLVKAVLEGFPDAEILNETDNVKRAGGDRWSR